MAPELPVVAKAPVAPRRPPTGRGPRSGGRCGGTSRALALALAAALAICALVGGAPALAHDSSFSDVTAKDPAHDAVEYLTKAKVLSGYADGRFQLGVLLNRGQAAKVLVLQNGLAVTSAGSRVFTDLDSIYGSYVRTASSKGWIAGYPDGTFRTYASLQRQHMAVIVVRSLGWGSAAQSLTAGRIDAVLRSVKDAGDISLQARPYVALALDRGLFQGGTDGRFRPTQATTRAQFALVAYRAELRGLSVVEGIRAGTDYADKTRIVFDLSNKPGTVTARMAGSQELAIAVAGSAVEGAGIERKIGSREVEFVWARQLTYRPQAAELRLRLNRFSRYELTTMAPSDGRGYRVVVDVFDRTTGPPGGGPPLVCLDAGHGGKDPGAIGVTGVQEKDVNLSITLEIDDYLRRAGIKTILTRSGDTYPTLDERTIIANDARATIFVSIHNNAAGDPASHGTESFYWGDAEEYSVEGKKLAEAIQRNLIEVLGSTDRGARTHWKNLHVLAESRMPAALAEVGFLTNPEEEARLKDPVYKQRAAWAVAKGILEYLGWSTADLPPLPST